MNSEYSNSEPIKLSKSSYTILCHKIISDITDYETISGNITTHIADHFAQFLLIKKCHVNYKSCSYYTYDYTNFSEEKFIYDYSMLDWTSLDNTSLSATDHFDNFYAKTTECLNSYIPK